MSDVDIDREGRRLLRAASVGIAPSAYAAVTAATDATCSQSFRVTVTSVASGQPASRITGSGEFDVPDGVAEESIGRPVGTGIPAEPVQ
jgi:hypothetical protein